MGDYKYSVNNSVGPVSAVEFQPSTKNSIFCTTPTVTDTVSSQHSAMQDDLLIEKTAVKSQQAISSNPEVNGDKAVKTKEDDTNSGKVSNNSIGLNGKQNDPVHSPSTVSTPLQIQQGYNVSEPNLNVVNTSNVSQAGVWPAEDGMLHNLAAHGVAVNGTLAFQNFQPSNPYNQLGTQMPGLTQNQGQSAQQRRAITAQHNFPPNIARQIQNHPPPNMYMANKGYPTTWSSPQQTPAWTPGPQNQGNMPGLTPWNRGRSVPNLNPALQNMSNFGNMGNRKPSPTFNQQMVQISPIKFRRSTSYPGKTIFPQHPTFEITNIDDNRDNMMLYQDRGMGNTNGTGPLENMRNLEHYLTDFMRGAGDAPDHLKVDGQVLPPPNAPLGSPGSRSSPHSQGSDTNERFSRKVFVGGLPPDIDEEEITASFRRFGPLVVDWPHKAESKSYFPPKGYAFLLFQDESSVQQLIDACISDDDKLYLCVSSPTIKDKPVQIRPWRLTDADFVLDASMPLDPRKTVFVGGVPRPLKALELATIMDRLYGGVCYAGIDTDPELKYPKGAGRVAFSNQQSYIAAISARFVQLQHGDIDKRVEVKPYVLDDQMCDECQGGRCGGKFAPFFCANVTCLQYYCENCWATIHSRPGREFHKPLVKEGADRPRAVPFRWC